MSAQGKIGTDRAEAVLEAAYKNRFASKSKSKFNPQERAKKVAEVSEIGASGLPTAQQILGTARTVGVIAASQLRGPSAAVSLPAAILAIGLGKATNSDLTSDELKKGIAEIGEMRASDTPSASGELFKDVAKIGQMR